MSNNTQTQGRNFYTERDYSYTTYTGDDAVRTNIRWEMDLQRQLYVGDVTKDGAVKYAAMMAPYIKTFSIELDDGIGALALTRNAAATVELAVITGEVDSQISLATTGSVPTGMTVSLGEGTVNLSGTPTGVGSFAFTVTVSAEGYTDYVISVAGNVANPPA